MSRFRISVAITLLVFRVAISDRAAFQTVCDEVMKKANSGQKLNWVSAVSDDFDFSDDKIKKLIGSRTKRTKRLPKFKTFAKSPIRGTQAQEDNSESRRLLFNYPQTLDLREKFPKCWSIGYVRDQAGCGSCWAVASGPTLSDRYCIRYSDKYATRQKSFSYQDMLENCPNSICGHNGNGCNGGFISGGFEYAKSVGICTGENYGNMTNCKPYFLPPNGAASRTPPLTLQCAPMNYTKSYIQDVRFILDYNIIGGTTPAEVVLNVIASLNHGGSVLCYVDIYQDFFTYRDGVYEVTFGKYSGGHAVRVIGYGTENGVDYWLFANTWGTGWGKNGFGKIRRGVNMCNIEAFCIEPFV